MIKKIVLPVIFALLVYGFWLSPDFKEIAAGVAIFLFGMLFLEEGFKAFTGGLLERLLARTTNRLPKAIGFGIVTTTIMQSSSLVSVITISFLSAGLITLGAGIGIIFGANIGTTTGAWLVAGFGLKVKISAYAMPMLVFGIILVFQNAKSLKGIGYVLAGLGFLFLGIHHMKEGFEAFRSTIDLTEFAMPGFMGLVIFTLVGMAATVIMQSSHATLVLIITGLSAGQVTYENALALAIGANIGTTITAIIGSLSSNYQGKRLAAAHLVFNVMTGLVAIVFISQIRWMVDGVSDWVGIAPDDFTLKLAVFHTIFNVIGVVLMTPLVGRLVRFLEGAIKAPREEVAEPKYLSEAVIDFPETLLESVRNELLHLYDNALEVMAHGLSLHRTMIHSERDIRAATQGNREVMEFDLDALYENKVKVLYAAILDFISRAQTSLPTPFADQLYELRHAARLIVQSVKQVKHLRKNVTGYVRSDNPHIRREYNILRIQIAMVMRELNRLRLENEEERDTLDLDQFKVTIEEESGVTNGTLDALIRDQKISAHMGSSLMNDHGYARDVVWNLVDLGQALFGPKDLSDREVDEMVALDETDVDEIMAEGESSPAEEPDRS